VLTNVITRSDSSVHIFRVIGRLLIWIIGLGLALLFAGVVFAFLGLIAIPVLMVIGVPTVIAVILVGIVALVVGLRGIFGRSK